MCIPHGKTTSAVGVSRTIKDDKPAKHIEFDEKNMKADPDFVDERTSEYTPKEKFNNMCDQVADFFMEKK
ncbi:MAG: hypothetical protein GQ570_07150 [Helicobacteraceae bacterium]|nr:hypothetical protein [Helicobacteraceae bacterium]